MSYKIEATGGNAPPNGTALQAKTALEALHLFERRKGLLDRATVRVLDDQGREIGIGELRQLAAKEDAITREQARNRHA